MLRPALLSSLIVLALIVVACQSDPTAVAAPASAPVSTQPVRKAAAPPIVQGIAGAPKSPEEAEMMKVQHPATKPVPLLSADETIATFNLPPGFRIEVVAEEPMVEHPVAMQFAPDGKLWVVEMRSYMPNIDGLGERKPNGRVSVLEDLDGDGRMDKSTVFWDGLVLPRAVSLVRDGALVAVPPHVWYARDTDGDGRSDERRSIAQDYGVRGNPEHQPNGLIHGLDNWIYSADYGRRIRWMDKQWVFDEYQDAGQWGITQDDSGRLFTNNNSNYLRGNLVAPHYVERNPHLRPSGVNVQIDEDQTCWPAHASAVNRGYRPGVLRPENYRLWKFTGACGPVIYRGGLFPKEFDGNYFTGEVTANFVRRSVLVETDGRIVGKNAYAAEEDEFLTSTYERFRPVNTYTGPEGALYIVDMHHGLIQHNMFVTPYVREQYASRELGQFNGNTGRIYRIVPDNGPIAPSPNLAKATNLELVGFLSHGNGWVRDTAQRLLVERRDSETIAPLRDMAMDGAKAKALDRAHSTAYMTGHARLHALWTLEGIDARDADVLVAALADPVGKIRAAAIRLSEPFLPRDSRVLGEVLKLSRDADPDVRLQFALSVSAVPTPNAMAALADVVTAAAEDEFVRDAAISGMKGRELEFLERLLADERWIEKSKGRDATLTTLTRCVIAEAKLQRVAQLLDVMASQSAPQHAWRQLAMVDSFPAIDPKRPVRRPVTLTTRPASIDALQTSASQKVRERADRVANVLGWPGKPSQFKPRRALSEAEQVRFEAGKLTYGTLCGQCHKPDGMGQAGLAPPLVDSEWALGDRDRLIKIVLHGLRGPITVNGERWDMDMPQMRILNDEEIANVLTYVRREWEHDGDPVAPADVARLRGEFADRQEAWTASELAATNRP